MKNFLKILKLILLNFLILICVVTAVEYCVYFSAAWNFFHKIPFGKNSDKTEYFIPFWKYNKNCNHTTDIREVLKTEDFPIYKATVQSNKRPILLFGCSFVWGGIIAENDRFGAQLAKLTQRDVYQRAFWGWGIQQMLFQLRHFDSMKNMPKDAEYIIFNYIDDHFFRASTDNFDPFNDMTPYLKYDISNGVLVERTHNFSVLWRFYFVRNIRQLKAAELLSDENYSKNNQQVVLKMFLESKEILSKKYPDSKFVILRYMQEPVWDSFDMDFWNDLKQSGIIIIDTKDLTDKNLSKVPYTISDTDLHPSAEAWKVIVPALKNKLDL